ncbi:helix-turn-helix domain-containing protein [Nocardioides sp. GY 10113]|uniref:helix-turn-helix domain-containing protein n=1 Tax=Nocardioides sp. GY 10113 TaxID=2569761 RepID=UPI0010A88A0B|nr:helix-turn-helix domain-containing protein [Nocardioides sp. GY 10113]
MTKETTRNDNHCCSPLMTPEEVSAYLGVPVKTLYRWRQHLAGPRALRVGKHLRYRRADLDSWLDNQAA